MNTLELLPVATRQTFQYKYTFLTDSNASLWLFSAVNQFTEQNFPQNVIGNFKHTYNYQDKMAHVFRPRSIIRALSRTHPELILGSFQSLILDKIHLNREMLRL